MDLRSRSGLPLARICQLNVQLLEDRRLLSGVHPIASGIGTVVEPAAPEVFLIPPVVPMAESVAPVVAPITSVIPELEPDVKPVAPVIEPVAQGISPVVEPSMQAVEPVATAADAVEP